MIGGGCSRRDLGAARELRKRLLADQPPGMPQSVLHANEVLLVLTVRPVDPGRSLGVGRARLEAPARAGSQEREREIEDGAGRTLIGGHLEGTASRHEQIWRPRRVGSPAVPSHHAVEARRRLCWLVAGHCDKRKRMIDEVVAHPGKVECDLDAD